MMLSLFSITLFLALINHSEVHVRELEQTAAQRKLFNAELQTDAKTGWKLIVLKYQDPADSSRNLEARIAPEAGSNLYSLKVGETELLVQPPELSALRGSRYGFPILYPTPNRVRDSKFTFDAVTYSFTPNSGKNFIHGLAHSIKWESGVPSADAKGATVQTWLDWNPELSAYRLFPISHRITMTYALNRDGVRMEFAVDNRDEKRLPFGFAFHPWFQILGSRADTYLHVPADTMMESVELLPTGKLLSAKGTPYDLREPVSLEKLNVDTVYFGIQPHSDAGYECRDRRVKVSLPASKEFTHMVVYTPPGKTYFCMENQTCSTDAHNMYVKGFQKEAHLLIAEKGKRVSGWVMVRVERMKGE
ncbi:MAG TPA: aldose 1-epimerase [Acidobacteriota bacterium]|nr:aldose 1-epimerase [Acidobacteriota bacterium]